MRQMATGGIVTGNKTFIFSESGEWCIVPLNDKTKILQSEMKIEKPVNINITISTGELFL